MYEYAIYRGDEFLVLGTKEECAEFLGVKPETIVFYCNPSYHRRVEKSVKPLERLIGVRLDDDEF